MEHDRNTADHCYNVDHLKARRDGKTLPDRCRHAERQGHRYRLDGLPMDTSFGHAGGAAAQHAPFALAAYWTVAKQRGYDLQRLAGTGQSDFNLTYLGCVTKQQIPPMPACASTRISLNSVPNIFRCSGIHRVATTARTPD